MHQSSDVEGFSAFQANQKLTTLNIDNMDLVTFVHHNEQFREGKKQFRTAVRNHQTPLNLKIF